MPLSGSPAGPDGQLSLEPVDNVLAAALAGDRASLARLLSLAERGADQVLAIEQGIAGQLGRALVIGITGPPGAGKSTLINALLPVAREAVGRVAVLAVDPSSPFSHGALLGDRVRMQGRSFGGDVFIRSMASRGEMGGLAQAASTCVRLFDACGWPLVIIETLGIGQVELDIMDLADAVVVVLNPGWGDSIQANKAGITEAGDLFVINKADKPGAAQTRRDLLDSLALLPTVTAREVVDCVATEGEGVAALWRAIEAHQAALAVDDKLQQRREQRRQRMLKNILRRQLEHRLDQLMASPAVAELIGGTSPGELDLGLAVDALIEQLGSTGSS